MYVAENGTKFWWEQGNLDKLVILGIDGQTMTLSLADVKELIYYLANASQEEKG